MKWQLHKLYKRIRYDEYDIRRYGHCVIDSFCFSDGRLWLKGWSYDRTHEGEPSRKILVKDSEGNILYEQNVVDICLPAINNMLGKPDWFKCGFDEAFIVDTPIVLDVFLVHELCDGRRFSSKLGTLMPSNSDLITAVFDRQNYAAVLGDVVHGCEVCIREHADLEVTDEANNEVVDVIVPVYNGMRYLPSLFRGIEQTAMGYRLIIVDDASPDDDVRAFLESYAAKSREVELVRNAENLGFVKSVNRGLSLSSGNVVIVNTDVELPRGWLERLMRPIQEDCRIASVTPFTNSGTICSFPRFCENNELPEGFTVNEVDEYFGRLSYEVIEIPTGVGFCMAMSRKAIDRIGAFDDDSFPRGYGEENDWCRRAVKAGFVNTQVNNLFVRHNHGGSFLSEEKKQLIENNSKMLLEKHPDYDEIVAKYIQKDPALKYRLLVSYWMIKENAANTILAIDHALGGGATSYLEDILEEKVSSGCRVVVMRYDGISGSFRCEARVGNLFTYFYTPDIESCIEVMGRLDEIWVNELVTYPGISSTLGYLAKAAQDNDARLTFFVHDYVSLCQSYNLMNYKGNFCGLPDHPECNYCFDHIRKGEFAGSGISQYRNVWENFLRKCDEVVAFSQSSIDLMCKVYPSLDSISLRPHDVRLFEEVERNARLSKTLTIGVPGLISYIKGRDVLVGLVKHIEQSQDDVEIRILGRSNDETGLLKGIETGAYEREKLPELAISEDIDVFFIPSICPETFSFTTSEVMSMGYPLVVFDIGAPAERLSRYDRGLILPLGLSSEGILKEIKRFAFEDLEIDRLPIRDMN